MSEEAFNLREVTGQESGIIVYGDGSVIVLNWTQIGDNCLPAVFLGGIYGLPHEDIEVDETYHTEDVRDEIPGSIWVVEVAEWTTKDAEERDGDSVLNTDIDILYDVNDDLPLLFGFDASSGRQIEVEPVKGEVYILSNGAKVIAPADWN